ncbi:SH3 domain-containing protein [Paraburkholderia sp. 22B1P]|uniref:SH3 domain-containing protein n=1 Tax=Paraburkholderia sp. 22B1P TaxID=3080498 RepID=UPI003090233B|nr:SH3 domain-containing protein [Paraburkholderia sp. 22B1P]
MKVRPPQGDVAGSDHLSGRLSDSGFSLPDETMKALPVNGSASVEMAGMPGQLQIDIREAEERTTSFMEALNAQTLGASAPLNAMQREFASRMSAFDAIDENMSHARMLESAMRSDLESQVQRMNTIGDTYRHHQALLEDTVAAEMLRNQRALDQLHEGVVVKWDLANRNIASVSEQIFGQVKAFDAINSLSPLEDVSKKFERLMRPFEEANRTMQLAQSFGKSLGTSNALQEMFAASSGLFGKLESLSTIASSTGLTSSLITESQAALRAFDSRLGEQLSVVAGSASADRLISGFSTDSALFRAVDPLDAWQKLTSTFAESGVFDRTVDGEIELRETDKHQLPVHSHGFAQSGAVIVTREELQGLVDRIVDKAVGERERTFLEAVELIAAEIRAQRTPLLEKMLWSVFVPILISLFFALLNPFFDFYVKDMLTPRADQPTVRQLKSEVKKHVLNTASDRRVLTSLRFVSCRKLEVHRGPKLRSPVLGELGFGRIVTAMRREKSWTLVALGDGAGNIAIQGWVLSRYLSTFR